MKMFNNQFSLVLALLTLSFILNEATFGQWSNNPAVNMSVCSAAGEQVLTKISPTSNGGCYISWFDNRSGSYAVYLQRLDPQGNKIFAADGLLISSHPQNTSLVDYDLITDHQDNAIITFTDIRNGGQINPFVYKISSSGQFLWGNNGVTLSDSFNVYQPNPKVVETSDGNFVFVWIYTSTPRKVCMQKLNANGEKQWGNNIYLSSGTTELYDWPWHVASDNGSIILLWAGYTGSFLSPQNYKLYSQKYSSNGTPVWNSTRDTVYSLGRVSGFYTPKIFPDGNNGAIYVWQDDRDATNRTNSYAQRKNSSGAILFPVNGSACGVTISDDLRFEPIAACMPSTNETYVFWQHKNSLQSQIGVYGQKFSANGTRMWTEDGIAFKPLNSNSFSSLNVIIKNEQIVVHYLEILSGGINCLIKSFSVNRDGSFLWGGIVTTSSFMSEKIRLSSCMNSSGMSMLSWQDNRNSAGDIYAQNIYLDGTVPVELVLFNAEVISDKIILKWTTASEKNNRGFQIERRIDNGQLTIDNWEKIGFIEGSGTTTEKQNYIFIDDNITHLTHSYRLKQIDYDGTFTFSNIITVETGLNSQLPAEFILFQNFPNPFNPSTTIYYILPQDEFVTLKVFDILGKETVVLIDNKLKEKGIHNYQLSNDNYQLSSGVYFYQLRAGDFIDTKKMIYLR